ncbi:MAG TPA: hypothetical protein VFB96_08590, partial [Pirellulaceae bacterium]|nr:hypothetical protein [Pirellulaceae bacterium]
MSESTGTPRRPFRFLYQFSLRTLLLATAAVAVFCNWYFQPKYHEEELAGKDLRVRRQMKLVQPVPVEFHTVGPPTMGIPGTPSDPVLVNHGHYTLLDRDDFVLSRGQFADDEESGNWATYYPTGNKATEGKMLHGVKVGLWRTWYEDGTPASEVTYADKPVEREQVYSDYRKWIGPGIGLSGVHPEKVVDPHVVCYCSREGPAKAWHQTGQLKFAGTYKDNQQDGDWSFFDPQGRLTAKGP